MYQIEVGEHGTRHIQGYLECVGKKSLAQLKKLPGMERSHLEVRRGTGEQARAYCMKLEGRVEGCTPTEWGEPKQQGKRKARSAFPRNLVAGRGPFFLVLFLFFK